MNYLEVVIAAFCCVFTVSLAKSIPYRQCGSRLATIENVDVSPCPEFPCVFRKGTNVTLKVTFIPKTSVKMSTAAAYGILGLFSAPYSLEDNNACHGMVCPLSPGQETTYTTNIYVSPGYPSLKIMVKWKLLFDSRTALCFTVPIAIRN